MNDKDVHVINFGKIYVNEQRSSTIVIENSGDFNFDFVIKKSSSLQQNLYLTISKETGTVKQNDKKVLKFTYSPLHKHRFREKHYIVL